MDAAVVFEDLFKEIFSKKSIGNFEDKLFLNKSYLKNFRVFLKYCVVEGSAFMVIAMIIYWQFFGQRVEFLVIVGAMGFFAPFGVNYVLEDIIFERNKRKKEEMLGDLLLEASVFCDDASMAKTIEIISIHDFGILGEDFKRAHGEIKNGAGVEEALERIMKLNKSAAYSRVIGLFLHGYRTGAKISLMFKESAEDLLNSKAIIKERQATMLITKYTLLLSAGIIVPAVLGSIIGLVSGFSSAGIGGIELGLSREKRDAIFSAAISAVSVYVFEYSVLSSIFLAQQEGNKKNFWIFASILVPLSMAVFAVAQSLS